MSAIINYILDLQDKPKEEPMILPFKPQFVEPILSGTKIHTIRLAKEGRWIPGRKIQFATGVRTKNYRCFKEGECVSTQDVFMSLGKGGILEISIDDKYLYIPDCQKLAINDGFKSYDEFYEWFYPIVNDSYYGNLNFTLIHWTDKRY